MHREKLLQIRRAALRSSLGMTLIEIMVVVAIASMIMGGVGLVAFQKYKQAQESTAKKDTIQIQQSVEMYMLQKKNKCPKTLQDLRAAGAITRVIKDPWGAEYEIKCPGEHGTVDVTSPGPDGELGTDDDISNYDDEVDEDEKK